MALRGTNQEFGRPYNRRIVLEAIRVGAPATRSQIAEQVGLTIQTVSTIIRELEGLGYIVATRRPPKGRGSPASALALNPEGGYSIGLHISPGGIEAGLVNLAGDIISRKSFLPGRLSPDTALELIATIVAEFRQHIPGRRLLGLGLALPGPFDALPMSYVGATTMQGWEGFPLVERLVSQHGLPVFFEADMAAAALGEARHGLGAEFEDFYYLFLGVGLGGCMVHEGALMRGAWGNAGEIGHIPVVPDGEPCPCGNRGCLERYVSLDAYARLADGRSPAQWAREAAPALRSAIITIENLFDPETIVLGGPGPAELLNAMAEALQDLPNSIGARADRKVPRVVLSDAGENAVLRGAAALVVAGVLSPRVDQMLAQPANAQDRKASTFEVARRRAS